MKHHASDLIDPLGTPENRRHMLGAWHQRNVLRFMRTGGRAGRFKRYGHLFDGWHGRRSPRALVHVWRRDVRTVNRVLHPKGETRNVG